MSKGGRVGYQLGKMVEDPREEEMSIQREDTPQVNTTNTNVDRTLTKMSDRYSFFALERAELMRRN